MGVSTRSKSSKTRSGNSLRRSLNAMSIKSPPVKKKIQAKSKPKSPVRPSSIRKEAENFAAKILARIKTVHHVGGSINCGVFDFYNYLPTLTRCLEGQLRRRKSNPKTKLWFFLKSEALDAQNDRHEPIIKRFGSIDLPIIFSVESEVAPINYATMYDSQNNKKEFFSFREAGLEWKELVEGFCILVSSRTQSMKTKEDEYALLPLKKPTMIDALKPDSAEQACFKYKGIDILVRSDDIQEDVEDAIKDEDALDLAKDLEPLLDAAKKEVQILNEKYEDRVQVEKNFFMKMVASLAAENQMEQSSVKASLDHMKVYKIYPEYEDETLPPPVQLQTFFRVLEKGSVKNAKFDVNSGYGNVDVVY